MNTNDTRKHISSHNHKKIKTPPVSTQQHHNLFTCKASITMLLNRFATKAVFTIRSRSVAGALSKFHSSAAVDAKVAVLGAAGGIGQPLSLLCKLSPEVDELSCYDIVGTPGVAADLSHVSRKSIL